MDSEIAHIVEHQQPLHFDLELVSLLVSLSGSPVRYGNQALYLGLVEVRVREGAELERDHHRVNTVGGFGTLSEIVLLAP